MSSKKSNSQVSRLLHSLRRARLHLGLWFYTHKRIKCSPFLLLLLLFAIFFFFLQISREEEEEEEEKRRRENATTISTTSRRRYFPIPKRIVVDVVLFAEKKSSERPRGKEKEKETSSRPFRACPATRATRSSVKARLQPWREVYDKSLAICETGKTPTEASFRTRRMFDFRTARERFEGVKNSKKATAN